MAKRGAFIVFEGLDRSGKSTQASRLLQALNEAGRKTHIFRFPDRAEPFGQVIDRYLRKEIDLNEHALHLAFSANRWEKADAIVEKINAGENVICDRYAFSGIAYSLAKGEASSARGIDLYGEAGLPTKWVRWADVGLPEPDLVLFFHVDAEVARSRGGFGDERLEQEELQRRVAAEMETLRADYWKTVNANRSLDEVAQEVQNIVDELVKRETLPPLGRLPPPSLP